MPEELLKAATLVDLLRARAQRQPDELLYTFLVDGEKNAATLTYGAADRAARIVAAHLQTLVHPPAQVLLIYPPGLDYIVAFLGCLYAGLTAVPLYPPRLDRPLDRFQAVVSDAGADLVLTNQAILMLAQMLAGADSASAAAGGLTLPGLSRLPWIATDALPEHLAEMWRPPAIDGATLAFLQYTSGSTGSPKGVMLSHANLLHNLGHIHHCFDHSPASRGVIWLPPYHDMGLIGGILQPLYGGFPVTLLSPLDFLQRPLRWLQAVSRYQATTSGGPNFAYDLCARKATPEEVAQLDLSSWRVAFNGAEPIRPKTLDAFSQVFAPAGFQPHAFYPCYGLAEATLIASGGRAGAPVTTYTVDAAQLTQGRVAPPADAASARTLIGNGSALSDQTIAIVDPQTRRRCPPGRVGEIWLHGPGIAQGYWGQPETSAHTFQAIIVDEGDRPYLRTGDLGFEHEGQLYVTGRLKDLIILRGRNYYPQDIEKSVEGAHPALRPGCGAAFAIEEEAEERLVVVQEVQIAAGLDLTSIIRAIRQAVAYDHQLSLYAIVLIEARSIPKTSSGKLQRYAARQAYLAGELRTLAQETGQRQAQEPAEELAEELEGRAAITAYLQRLIGRYAGIPPSQVEPAAPLSSLGLDSLLAVELRQAVEDDLGQTLPLNTFLEAESVAAVVEQLMAGGKSAEPRPELVEGQPVEGQPTTSTPASEFPLTYPQKRLWFLEQLAPQHPAYNLPFALQLDGDLNITALEDSLNTLIARHAILRTVYTNAPMARTVSGLNAAVSLSNVEAGAWGSEPSTGAWAGALTQAARQPFDLSNGPLLRAHLWRLSPTRHVFLLNLHHIVADGWAMGIFWRELAHCYTAFDQRRAPQLPALPWAYGDFARWQANWESTSYLKPHLEYWRQRLSGAPPHLDLPADHPRPTHPTLHGAHHITYLPPEQLTALEGVSRQAGVTLYMTLLAVFQVWLHHTTGRADNVIGADIANRHWPGSQAVMGLFVNQLPLRGDPGAVANFADLLRQVRRHTLDAFAHQDAPFDKIVEALKPPRDPGRNPLFQVMFVLENAPLPALTLPGLQVHLLDLDTGGAPFDLSLLLSRTADGLRCDWRYSTSLFERVTVSGWAAAYETALRLIAAQPSAALSTIHDALAATYQTQAAQRLSELRMARQRAFARPRRSGSSG